MALCAGIIFLILMLLIVATPQSKAHSWYDKKCCSKEDCAPVIKMTRTPNGSWIIRTKKGMALLPKTEWARAVKVSKDNRYHACIVYGDMGEAYVRCFYVPAGV